MSDMNNTSSGNSPNGSFSNNGSNKVVDREDLMMNAPADPGEQRASLGYQKGMAGLMRFKWVILLFAVAGATGAWYFAQEQEERYRSMGSLIIHQEVAGGAEGRELGGIMARSTGVELSRAMEDQLLILGSRSFNERVASTIMDLELMENGDPFPILSDEVGNPRTLDRIVTELRRRTTLERTRDAQRIILVTHESTDPVEAKQIPNIIMDQFVEYTYESRRENTRSTIDFMENVLLAQVGDQLREAEREVEQFMRSVDGGINLDAHTTRIVGRINALDDQIASTELEMDAAQKRRANLELELEEIRPGFSDHLKEAVGPRVQMLQENIASLTIERILTLERNPNLRGNEDAEPRLREINRDIAAYREEIDQLVGRSLEGTTGFLMGQEGGVNRRVIELRRAIAEQMIEMERMKALIARAKSEIETYERDLNRLPEDQTRLVRLERQRQLHERMYNDMAARQVELRLQEQSTTGNGRVFDYARQPTSPYYPDIPLFILFGLLGGLVLSAGTILLVAIANKSIDSIDVMKSYNLPLLSVIPEIRTMIKKEFKGKPFFDTGDHKVATSLTAYFDPVSSVAEAYRRLYNNIRFNNPDKEYKMLVVTSPGKFEGKSTCTANLAISMCGAGRRVVLVDCDFRRPMQHTLFGKEKRPGVIDHLFSSRKIEDVITPTMVEGLDLIPAGVEPSSPGLAANSDKMREMLRTLSKMYDHVIIDTPPFGIINDAAPIIKQADGVLALARFKRTTTTDLDQLLEGLRGIRAGIIGTVLMDFNPKAASGYYAYNKLYSYNSKVYQSYQEPRKKSALTS